VNLSNLLNSLQRNPRHVIYRGVARLNNLVVRPAETTYTSEPLIEISQRMVRHPSDISDHLPLLFIEAMLARPELIVELGVRGGESTFVFERAAKHFNAHLVSIDIEDCSGTSDYERWHFIQGDDVQLAHNFADWCRAINISPAIDVLFIDTSHLYEHTVQEINAWFPLLAANAKVIFHDTHMTRLYRRRNGSMGVGWENERGVIAAIEEYLGRKVDETRDFVEWHNPWIIRHFAGSNGLTILEKLDDLSSK
jgi:cephalosporin hydroxylase